MAKKNGKAIENVEVSKEEEVGQVQETPSVRIYRSAFDVVFDSTTRNYSLVEVKYEVGSGTKSVLTEDKLRAILNVSTIFKDRIMNNI
jgi:hypothetical protein